MSDLLTLRPNGAAPWSEQITRERWEMDSPWGSLHVAPALSRISGRHSLTWVCESRTQLEALRDVLETYRGRHTAFWLPTLRLDLDVISQSDSDRTIRACGYTDLVTADASWLELVYYTPGTPAGSTGQRTVTASDVVDNEDGTETFTIATSNGDAATGAGSLTSAGARWMFRRRVRLADDAVRIRFHSGEVAQVQAMAQDISGSTL